MKDKKYTAISLFAGVGGICLGFKNVGVDIIWANDIDTNACKTYRNNFSHTIVEGKIENIKTNDIPDADLMLFGFPCQSFSIAGYQNGFNDEKTGHLFFEALRIMKAKQPKAFLLENVKNLISHDKGNTFKIMKDALQEEGYFFRYQVLNSMEYGNIPQNRERIYVVGFKNKDLCDKFYFPEPIILTKTIHDITKPDKKKDEKYYYKKNSKYYEMLNKEIINKNTIYQLRRVYVRENKKGVCPTLTANMGKGGHNVPLILDDFGIRKLTPHETFMFQGFPESYKLLDDVADCHLYTQAGNSVTVTVIQRIAENMIEVLSSE